MYRFSKHFLQQMQLRKISMAEIEDGLNHPQQKVSEDQLTVYQKVIRENNKSFLLRIFVNELKQPPMAVTVYKTTKIDKYLNG